MIHHLLHLKSLLMVLTAAAGTIAGGTMVNSFSGSINSKGTASFLMSLSPSSMTITQGASATSNITIMSVNGYAGTVSLSLFYPGQKLTATVTPAKVTLPANGMARSVLTVTAPGTPGTYEMVVIGLSTSHGRTSYASSMLTVQVQSSQDFTITAAPSSITNIMGGTNTTVITVASVSGFSGFVNLTVTAPFGYITVTGGQNPLMLTPGGTASSTLTISTSSLTALGTYRITVTGTSGSRSHATRITLNVVDPTTPPVENLVRAGFEYLNGTELILNLQDTGNTSITLVSYTVQDTTGDAWTLNNWNGPTFAPNSGGTAIVLIGSSCPGCIYTGITGLFFTFQPGHTYSVVVTTTLNNRFTFTQSM